VAASPAGARSVATGGPSRARSEAVADQGARRVQSRERGGRSHTRAAEDPGGAAVLQGVELGPGRLGAALLLSCLAQSRCLSSEA
jgi:hypothetical protein